MADYSRIKHPSHLRSREQLMAVLQEAAEVEHTLMCTYLYAAFSIKTDEADGLTAEQAATLRRWRGEIISIAVEEMSHLALVSNLLTAIGGAPHFSRLNFPIAPGPMPAGMTVRLSPFTMDTLQHFIYLERPDNVNIDDGEAFKTDRQYRRGAIEQSRLMPMAYDYATVGELYKTIMETFISLNEQYGEDCLFTGCPQGQIGPDITPLPGLCTVHNLTDAIAAIETIVEQGEGAPADCGKGHFARFCKIKKEYDAFLQDDPSFKPGRPVAENPVMRPPPTPDGKVWVTHPDAAAVMDFVNALYVQMLRMLSQAFGRTGPVQEKRALINAATDLMYAMTPAATHLTRLPANDTDDCNAGMSFAMARSVAALPGGAEWNVYESRLAEILEVGRSIQDIGDDIKRAVDLVESTKKQFERDVKQIQAQQVADAAAIENPQRGEQNSEENTAADNDNSANQSYKNEHGIETVEGENVTLTFDSNRCIHSRFCVTGAPKTFVANVEGEWLYPDKTDPDLLYAIARECPSGAITITRKEERPDEQPPEVNVLRVRENGPLAVHADIRLDGEPDGFRRTLCRCGQSKVKPYCDNSHIDAGFAATGEPKTGNMEMLAKRGGELIITPQVNGPYRVSGPLEICAGTGRGVERTTSTRLCRCGASKNKPFCDNSHIEIGFRSEDNAA